MADGHFSSNSNRGCGEEDLTEFGGCVYLDPRECEVCKFVRIPIVKIVKQKTKQYKIFECTMCHMKDIESHTPRKIWDGKNFVDEDPDEPFFNPGL